MKKILVWSAVAALLIVAMTTIKVRKVHAQVTSIILDWTAPNDLPLNVAASKYEIRYSTTKPDTTGQTAWLAAGGLDTNVPAGLATWWSNATIVTAIPVPKAPGTAESFAVPGSFTAGRTYYFELRTCDLFNNCSRSNITAKSLPDSLAPAAILDLRAR